MRLARYVGRRMLLLIPVLLGVTFITFALTRIIPGNPVDRMVHPMASQEVRERVVKQYGLDLPFYVQYVRYLRDLSHGDFGTSFVTSQPVLQDLTGRFPATFELTTYATILAFLVALPLGIYAALRRDSWFDHLVRLVTVIGAAMPIFWLSLVLLYFFFFRLHIVPPPIGRLDPLITPPPDLTGLLMVDSLLARRWDVLWNSLTTLILPVSVLAFAGMAPIVRVLRAEMIEVLESDYVRGAYALGLPQRTIIFKYALKNSLLPVVTILAVVYGFFLGGSVLLETIFAWPGLGRYAYIGTTSSDYPAIQGFILYATTMYVLVFLILDVLYVWIDPRIEY